MAILVIGGALLGVGLVSRYALLSVLIDGLSAAVVMLPGMLAGLWLVPLLRLDKLPLRWHILLGATMGIGLLSTLVLVLGLAGLLGRTLWITLQITFLVAGLWRLRLLLVHPDLTYLPNDSPNSNLDYHSRYLWLLLIPFLSLALIAASNPPGLIWQEEGYGYDVLEYHLQLPIEYADAGRIQYAPHNVYANFPANVEMLYLLTTVLFNPDREMGVVANMIHLFFAVMTVFAAWVAGREWSRQCGVACAVLLGTTGWLVYLSGLAYVENGMLFFGMTATAALCRAIRNPNNATKAGIDSPTSPSANRWLVASGLCAGFACGCKYTAVAMIAMPLMLVALFIYKPVRARVTSALVTGIAALIAFSPWLLKNTVMTGNPVFPLANEVFRAEPPGWGVVEQERWDRGHAFEPNSVHGNNGAVRGLGASLSRRIAKLWDHVLWDEDHRFGPTVILLALSGVLLAIRERIARNGELIDLLLVSVLIMQLAVWFFATHMYARFAVVFLIPLVLLAGRVDLRIRGTFLHRLCVTTLVCGAVFNLWPSIKRVLVEAINPIPVSLIADGKIPGYEFYGIVNEHVPDGARVLLVGEARALYFDRLVDYHVVFNRNPFAEAVSGAYDDGEIVQWLRDRGYDYVLVNWSEIGRLSATYGFAPEITQALFDRLVLVGLSRHTSVLHPTTGGRYVELYFVPPE